jgi:hypothetical protein
MSQKMLLFRPGTIPQAARPGAQIRCGHPFRLVNADVKATNPHFDCRGLPHRSRAVRNRAPSRGQKSCKRKRRSGQPISTSQCGRGSAKNGGWPFRTRRGIRERGAHCSARVRRRALSSSWVQAQTPSPARPYRRSPGTTISTCRPPQRGAARQRQPVTGLRPRAGRYDSGWKLAEGLKAPLAQINIAES